MDSFLIMVSETLWGELTNTQLDTALKLLHGRMVDNAPKPYASTYGTVPTWDLDYANHKMTGFLELDAGPQGEHVVTLFDLNDVELMEKAPHQRLRGDGLRQLVFLRTVN